MYLSNLYTLCNIIKLNYECFFTNVRYTIAMRLYNTKSRKVEEFTPIDDKKVTMYACGPTVYDYTHIGHIRKYIGDDILKRVLIYLGYNVKHVMNITDVGHLVSDEDSGEDKMEKGAKKSGKTVWEVAQFYTDYFHNTMRAINITEPTHTVKATDHILAMIELIKKLEEKGFTYKTKEAIYFDVTKDKDYGKLSGQKLEDKEVAVREEVNIDLDKKHSADFALWFFRVGRFADHAMHWSSPWGDGFPGWHIECSAMSMQYLGEHIDIHTGGVDHIPVHHENEIAQSECATGHTFVNYWVHHAFLNVNNEKMSKSKGNFFTIDDIKNKNIDPLSLRLLFMQGSYRKPMNFTFESAESAQIAYHKLLTHVSEFKKDSKRTILSDEKLQKIDVLRAEFKEAISDDLNTSKALSVMWEVIKSNIPSSDKLDLLYNFDEVLGFDLRNKTLEEKAIPIEIEKLAQKRWEAKRVKKWELADNFRKQLEEKGYKMEEAKENYIIKKN